MSMNSQSQTAKSNESYIDFRLVWALHFVKLSLGKYNWEIDENCSYKLHEQRTIYFV